MKIVPFADFRKSGHDMPAAEYGKLVSDCQWDDDRELMFRVYPGEFYIEHTTVRGVPQMMLILGNQSWITSDVLTLEDLEYRLWLYARRTVAEDLLSGLPLAMKNMTNEQCAAVKSLTDMVGLSIGYDGEDALDRLFQTAMKWRDAAVGKSSDD